MCNIFHQFVSCGVASHGAVGYCRVGHQGFDPGCNCGVRTVKYLQDDLENPKYAPYCYRCVEKETSKDSQLVIQNESEESDSTDPSDEQVEILEPIGPSGHRVWTQDE